VFEPGTSEFIRTGFFQSMLLFKAAGLAPTHKPYRLACASARALMVKP
jgi:hypothetical protein